MEFKSKTPGEFTIRPARYAKHMIAISCPSPDGFKTRAARLADCFSKGRYSNRERAYIMSIANAGRFVKAYREGKDVSAATGKLIEKGDLCKHPLKE